MAGEAGDEVVEVVDAVLACCFWRFEIELGLLLFDGMEVDVFVFRLLKKVMPTLDFGG